MIDKITKFVLYHFFILYQRIKNKCTFIDIMINGILFGLLSTLIAQLWFESIGVSVSIGLSMLVTFMLASLLGTTIPIALKRMGFDPAVASSVIVITLVDIIGFFSFPAFRKYSTTAQLKGVSVFNP